MRGRIRVPGDKSISHRAFLLAALAEGTSVIRGASDGDDVFRTRRAVQLMGAEVDRDRVHAGRSRLRLPASDIDVGNSGTTIRLLAGMCATLPGRTTLYGDESIARRPMDRVIEPLQRMGARIDGRNGGRFPPLVVEGAALTAIEWTPPVASAQVKSAVLLAGLASDGETVVHEPVRTRAHTEELLAACGADIRVEEGGHTIRVRRSDLHAFELDVPGDPSQAAFWIVAATITPGSDVTVDGVYLGRARSEYLEVLIRMGADIEVEDSTGSIRARHASLRATDISGDEIPGLDEVPVLAVAAAMAEGVTTIHDAAELRVKESDRIAVLASELTALGAHVEEQPDGLVIEGVPQLHGARVRSHGDHRIAMALAVAALSAAGETVIEGWDAVATSYPGFAEELERCAS